MAKKRSYRNGAQIKRSREDLVNGPMGEIWTEFLAPIVDAIKDCYDCDEDKQAAFDMLFAGRTITQYRLKKDMYALGQEIGRDPFNYNHGNDANKLRRDSRIFIRNDETQAYADFETEDGRVFRISKGQLKEIEKYLSREQ